MEDYWGGLKFLWHNLGVATICLGIDVEVEVVGFVLFILDNFSFFSRPYHWYCSFGQEKRDSIVGVYRRNQLVWGNLRSTIKYRQRGYDLVGVYFT